MSIMSAKKLLMVDSQLRPRDFFRTFLGTAAELDALDLQRQDLLIGKSRVNYTSWSWRNSALGLSRTFASNTQDASAPFSSYANALGAGSAIAYGFKKKPKAFDIVQYTGNGSSSRLIPHGLAVPPGMIIVKGNSPSLDWTVTHRSIPLGGYLRLNADESYTNGPERFPNSGNEASFSVGPWETVNRSGVSYVAHLFAHNPDVMQCVSFVPNASGAATINHGWPSGAQFALVKVYSSTASGWEIFDRSRSLDWTSDRRLQANVVSIEDTVTRLSDNAGVMSLTGLTAGVAYIAMLIRS